MRKMTSDRLLLASGMNCCRMMKLATITAIREDVVNDVIDGFIAPMGVEEQ